MKFWDLLDRTGDCWIWTGPVTPQGYGNCHSVYNEERLAHRQVWILAHGSIPEGRLVLHHCDNRLCCRPSHLFLGTQLDNIRDAKQKGRLPSRSNRWNAKLTEEQVVEIRQLTIPQRAIAAQFGISQAEVSHIKTGRVWR